MILSVALDGEIEHLPAGGFRLANPWIWFVVTDKSGNAVAPAVLLGRCVQGLFDTNALFSRPWSRGRDEISLGFPGWRGASPRCKAVTREGAGLGPTGGTTWVTVARLRLGQPARGSGALLSVITQLEDPKAWDRR